MHFTDNWGQGQWSEIPHVQCGCKSEKGFLTGGRQFGAETVRDSGDAALPAQEGYAPKHHGLWAVGAR